MSVQYITANALDFPENTNVLVHGVNCGGVMASGIAKSIREEYPAAYDAYMEAHKNNELQLGMFSVAEVVGGKRIINLCTQEKYGTDKRYIDYEALYVGLSRIKEILEGASKEGRKYSLVMPWVGCGLAGGSRKVVKAMIEDIFEESEIRVVVAELGVKK